jgi:hypothetical protein
MSLCPLFALAPLFGSHDCTSEAEQYCHSINSDAEVVAGVVDVHGIRSLDELQGFLDYAFPFSRALLETVAKYTDSDVLGLHIGDQTVGSLVGGLEV